MSELKSFCKMQYILIRRYIQGRLNLEKAGERERELKKR